MSPTPRKPTEEHTFIAIRVESHDVNLTAGINFHLFGITAHYIDPDAAVFESMTRLDIPHGLAVIERRRSDGAWTAQVPVEPKLVTHMLILLGQTRQTYLSIHERRLERRRWVRSISLQTTDPTTE